MTNSKMSVLSEIRKVLEEGDADVLRDMVRVMAEILMASEGDARAAGTAVFGTSPQLWSDYSNFLETEGIEEQASSGNPGPFMWAGTRCNTATAATLLDVSIAAGDLAACNLGDVIRCDKFATFDYYAVTNAYVNELFVCATFG